MSNFLTLLILLATEYVPYDHNPNQPYALEYRFSTGVIGCQLIQERNLPIERLTHDGKTYVWARDEVLEYVSVRPIEKCPPKPPEYLSNE